MRHYRPITVSLEIGSKTVTPRLRLGALAVTPLINGHGDVVPNEFVVTHIPTGLRIGHVSFPFTRACAFCRGLHAAAGEAFAVWTLTRIPTANQRASLRRRCHAVLESIYEAER